MVSGHFVPLHHNAYWASVNLALPVLEVQLWSVREHLIPGCTLATLVRCHYCHSVTPVQPEIPLSIASSSQTISR